VLERRLLRPCSRLEAGSLGGRWRGVRKSDARGQLHFELLASTKLLTELTAVDAVLTTVAI
jgi:hypothetical protein